MRDLRGALFYRAGGGTGLFAGNGVLGTGVFNGQGALGLGLLGF